MDDAEDVLLLELVCEDELLLLEDRLDVRLELLLDVALGLPLLEALPLLLAELLDVDVLLPDELALELADALLDADALELREDEALLLALDDEL